MNTDALTEVRRYRRRIIAVIVVLIGGFFLWAALTDLAKGVHVFGTVVPDTRRKLIQPQVNGVVDQVMARDGQEVSAGDPIIILDQRKLLATKNALERRSIELELAAERYGAELRGAVFRPDLAAYQKRHPDFAMPVLLEIARSAASASIESLAAQLQAISAQESRLASEIQGAQASIEILNKQKAIVEEQLRGLAPVVEAGLYPRADYQRQEQAALDLLARLDEREVARRTAENQIAGLAAERQRLLQENRRKLSDSVAAIGVEIHQVSAQQVGIAMDILSSTVRAPVAGQLISFATTSVGSMVTAGQTIGQIVPKGEPLIVEASVNPADIERIAVGTIAEVRFSSLPRKISPLLRGHVAYKSRDTIAPIADMSMSASTQALGYQIRVVIDPAQLHKLGEFEIIPGMPVEIFSDGGTRSVLDYFVSPFTQLFEGAMREY